MALTQQQWYDKLRSFVPSWWFEQERNSVALFQAIAAVFQQLNVDADDQFLACFFDHAVAPVLDEHGDERSIARLPNELDPAYSQRIKNITSHTNKPDIEALVNSLLLSGTCQIFETPMDNPYCSRGSYLTRHAYLTEMRRNYFLIVVPPQIHAPYSFLSRSYFASRLDFVGAVDSTSVNFASITAVLDQVKAFGCMYGILETTS